MLIAFDADIEAHKRSNGYVIAEQGKPPDFVLEIASQRTGREDSGNKRKDYAGFGIAEYWRFDETKDGRWHGARLAGDRLVDGAYQPIPIVQLRGDILEGYSRILNLHLRWENGNLRWHKPGTTRPIATFADERLRADREREARLQAEARADRAREARLQAEARADRAREARLQAEARADRAREARLQAEARAEDERARADRARKARLQAEARADRAEARAEDERARADRAREARLQAEARVRELEARLEGIGEQ